MQPEANGRSSEAATASVCDNTDEANEINKKATEEKELKQTDDDTGKNV